MKSSIKKDSKKSKNTKKVEIKKKDEENKKIEWKEQNKGPRNIYANLEYKIEPIKILYKYKNINRKITDTEKF